MKNDFDDLNCELRPGIEKKEKKLKQHIFSVWSVISLLLVFSVGVLAAGLISNVLHYTPAIVADSVEIISNLGDSGSSPSFLVGTSIDISVTVLYTGGHTENAQVQILVGATGIICSDVSLTGVDASQICTQGTNQVILFSNSKVISLNVVWNLFLMYNTVLSNNIIDISLVQ